MSRAAAGGAWPRCRDAWRRGAVGKTLGGCVHVPWEHATWANVVREWATRRRQATDALATENGRCGVSGVWRLFSRYFYALMYSCAHTPARTRPHTRKHVGVLTPQTPQIV